MYKDIRVASIIVTYNRKDLLIKCLEANLRQSHKLEEIVVINNASNDGTHEILEDFKKENRDNNITIINLESNIGGAGGFYEGIKYSITKEYDFYWIMDDDTIPQKDALEKMLEKNNELNEKIGFLCSNVLFKDNTPCLMNIPAPYYIWNEHINNGVVRLESTSFVSALIKKEAIKEVGLPIKEFFIWGDDSEYTRRISKNYNCYMVSDSIVHHLMNNNSYVDIVTEGENRLGRYFYEYRNKFYISRKRGSKYVIEYLIYLVSSIIKVILKSKSKKLNRLKYILKGFIAGLFFNPTIEKI